MEELAEARKLHEGYPTLKEGRLSSNVCLYCGQHYSSREKLFAHLKKMIPGERMINGWHQEHFLAPRVTPALLNSLPLRCPARCCASKTFDDVESLLDHIRLMGVRGADQLVLPGGEYVVAKGEDEGTPAAGKEETQDEESRPHDPYADIGKCYKCHKQHNSLFAQCGHVFACADCARSLAACQICGEDISQKIEVC